MIIIENIFYFILILTMVFLYGYIVKIIYLYLKQIIKEKKFSIKKEIFNIVPKTNIQKLLFLVFILFNFSMHMANRSEWINKNTAHHDAKEYLATYIDLHFYKKVLNNFFHIDNAIFIPLNILTDQIYKRGISYLPKEDGEIAFWYYHFYGYFYVRGSGYMPNINLTKKVLPSTQEQIYILDSMYKACEDFATKPIKDKKIFLEKYKAFSSMGNYFITKRLWYFGNHVNGTRYSKSKKNTIFMKKTEKLLYWAVRFKNEYKKYDDVREVIDVENPILSVSYYFIILSLSQSLLFLESDNNKFNCKDKIVDIYLKHRDELVKKDSSLYRLSKQQELLVKSFNYHTYGAYAMAIIIKDRCKIKVSYGYPSDEWILKNVNFNIK